MPTSSGTDKFLFVLQCILILDIYGTISNSFDPRRMNMVVWTNNMTPEKTKMRKLEWRLNHNKYSPVQTSESVVCSSLVETQLRIPHHRCEPNTFILQESHRPKYSQLKNVDFCICDMCTATKSYSKTFIQVMLFIWSRPLWQHTYTHTSWNPVHLCSAIVHQS